MSRDGSSSAAGLPDREEGAPAPVGGAISRTAAPAVHRRVSFVRQESRSEFHFPFSFLISISGNGELGVRGWLVVMRAVT